MKGLGEYVILLMAIGKQESITFTLKEKLSDYLEKEMKELRGKA